jgi:hypothetical protein
MLLSFLQQKLYHIRFLNNSSKFSGTELKDKESGTQKWYDTGDQKGTLSVYKTVKVETNT